MAEDFQKPIPVAPLEYAYASESEAIAHGQFRQGLLLVATALAAGAFADAFSATGGLGLFRASAGRVFTLLSVALMACGGWLVLRTGAGGKRRASMLPIVIPLLVLAAGAPVARPFVKLLLMRYHLDWSGPSGVIMEMPRLLWGLACVGIFIHIWRVLRAWQLEGRHLMLLLALLVSAGWSASIALGQAWMFLSDQPGGRTQADIERLHVLYKIFRAAAGLAAMGLAGVLAKLSLSMRGSHFLN